MVAFADYKIIVAGDSQPCSFAALDGTARRLLGFETLAKFFQFRPRAFHLDKNALRRVVDPTGKTKVIRKPMDERTKTHALHCAAKGKLEARGFDGEFGFGDGHANSRTGVFFSFRQPAKAILLQTRSGTFRGLAIAAQQLSMQVKPPGGAYANLSQQENCA